MLMLDDENSVIYSILFDDNGEVAVEQGGIESIAAYVEADGVFWFCAMKKGEVFARYNSRYVQAVLYMTEEQKKEKGVVK